jgi:hypothetical protein
MNNINNVFIIDLDGTIIGDCIYQTEIYKISLILAKLGHKIKIGDILDKHYNEKSKLIRPHFVTFILKMKEIMPNSYFYIYTASEKKWAEKEISIIEKNINIKFDRPIFTRNDCYIQKDKQNDRILFTKSIDKIKKKIKVSNPEIIIIDDKEIYLDNNSRLINCKMYNYKCFCNYWDYIPISKIKNKIFINYLEKLIEENRLSPYYNTNTTKKKCEYYKWLYLKTTEINNYNKKYKKDNFWLNLTKIINEHKINQINDNSINLIKELL